MRIAVFDYLAVPNNPIGGCHWRMLRGLCQEHEFTVFAAEFNNPCPERITFVRIPAIQRPLALLFITYHLLAPIWYLVYRLRTGKKFDRIQFVESNLLFGDTSYCHFCHRSFLRNFRDRIGSNSLRSRLRLLDHYLHALVEPWAFRRAKTIIVPSRGLATELKTEYPFIADKIVVLSNPVELDRMKAPGDFDRTGFRTKLGFTDADVVLVFAALGHFERKGLPLLLEAMSKIAMPTLKLCVVGGESNLIADYQAKIIPLGLAGQVVFTGMQKDVRPYLWSAEAFVLPSYYETFSLVAFEAAAAEVPVVAPRLYGVEEFLQDGKNGFLIEATAEGVRRGLDSLLKTSPADRREMGRQAALSVTSYGLDAFLDAWKKIYVG